MKHIIKKIFPYIIGTGLFFTSGAINAQINGTINGQLIEKGTTRGLNGQTVKIYYNGNETPTNTTTNSEGMFDIITGVEKENNTNAQNQIIYNTTGNNLKINTTGTLTIYNMIGQKVREEKILENESIKINNLASGTYLTTQKTNNENYSNKILFKEETIIGIGKKTQNKKNTSQNYNKLFKTTNGTTIDSIIIKSPQINGIPQAQDTTIKGKTYTNNNIKLGVIELNGKNNIKGLIYDLETSEPVDNTTIFLSSTPEKKYNLQNGIFEFKTTQNSEDTLKIISNEYYNITHPIKIQIGTTQVHGLNDQKGLLNVKRQTDTTAIYTYYEQNAQEWKHETRSQDYMEFLQYLTDFNLQWQDDPVYKNTSSRFRNEDMPIKVYLSRQTAPNNWYSDSVMSAFKALENNILKFEETTDSINAQMHIDYKNINIGNGKKLIYEFDNQGPYLKHWGISLNNKIKAESLPYVAGHELMHTIFSGGILSDYISDILYGDPTSSHAFGGLNTIGSDRERKIANLLYTAPRNTKWLEYTR